MKSLLRLLQEPELQGRDADDPGTSEIHGRLIKKKPLLRDVYVSFYSEFVKASERVPQGCMVELGSGGGFLKEYLPSVTTSDILGLSEADIIFSAEAIGFRDSTISAFFLLDVFHHIADARKFLQEAQRCLKPGGRLVMIEPANTFWGRLIRRHLHHESHDESAGWGLDGSRPLSDANLALPWIVFVRDREIFQQEFPSLSILRYESHTPLRYILSGGISYRSPVPKPLIPVVKLLEYALSPLNRFLGMHVTIEIVKLTADERDKASLPGPS